MAETRDSNSKRLTAVKVSKLKKPGLYGDGDGLYLQVSRWRTRSWVLRYMRNGRARKMGLGPVKLVSLAQARDRAIDYRRMLLDGIDPIEARCAERMKARIEAAKSVTFQHCAEQYIATHESSWRNDKHRAQWRSTLKRYTYPVIGDLPVAAIDTGMVVKILDPLWQKKTETASRLRGRIESVLDYAKVRGFRHGENPARWQGHLKQALPDRSKIARVRHQPALPYEAIPAFMGELRARDGISARALEFTILTAARTGAVVGATWPEIDIVSKTWRVPPERTGTKIVGEKPEPRRVPLSDRAIKILQSLPREAGNPHVFIGAKSGQPLSNMAMLELMRGMRQGYVPHGFRSSFKDWCSETTAYANEISEAALWHVIQDKTEAAYRRGDLFEKRCRLMADWASYCAQPPQGARDNANVVPLRGSGAA